MIEQPLPYLTTQLIAYIGNKRKLLGLIDEAVGPLADHVAGPIRFLDLFAGSGVVSRYGKLRGFEVISNDWESYAHVINSAHVAIDESDIARLFGDWHSFDALLEHLNNLPDPAKSDQYVAEFYAPREVDPAAAVPGQERMFYTRSNALRIDAIRNEIDRLFCPACSSVENQCKRNLLVAQLLYEAATHTNTSGVFKAYHRGFGGHGGDALRRILAPITMRRPVLINSQRRCMVFQRDANELVRSSDAGDLDVAYLDPPYNQHQYGSNYHMLNTIARWDKIPMPISFGPMGDLTDKAGIRRDWKNTKSAYCSRSTAAKAFQEMLADLDARRIVLSYSTDGIIAFDELREMCETRGNVSIVTNEYSKFKGGRQSNTRATKNIEFVLVVDTDRKLPKPKASIVDTALCMRRLRLLFSSRYRKCDLMRHFDVDLESEAVDLRQSSGRRRIETSGFFRLTAPCWLDQISADEAARLVCALEQCACRTCDEQLEEIERLVKEKHADAASFVNEMPALLRKLANPKYVDLYYGWAERIEKLAAENCGLLAPIKQKIMRLADIAEKRLASRTG